MKSFKSVEENRRAYHQDAARNSVHRSSLMVPELPGSDVEISFLNHFLLKRGMENVACRVTAVDTDGQRIEARLHTVDEPRVYRIPLSGMADGNVASYIVEFFSPDNLFIPFPAVMVNHFGSDFLNSVHSYNRVLNDVFEDDAVNSNQVAEASIDVRLDSDTDGFAIFTAGPQPCRDTLEVEFSMGEDVRQASVPLDVPRFGNQTISLKALFPDIASGNVARSGVLKMRQPLQPMFYGRMLAGMRQTNGAISANHSYYDSTGVEEYWDDARSSVRMYPLFDGLRASARFYPIMSPGEVSIALDAYDKSGQALGTVEAGTITSPGGHHLDVCVTDELARAGLEGAASYAVRGTPTAGNTPTRIAHQAVYGDSARPGRLESSISVGLVNPNVFLPEGKTGMAWGQVPLGGEIESWLGIVGANPKGSDDTLDLQFYDETGLAGSINLPLPEAGCVCVDPAQLAETACGGSHPEELRYLWFEARTQRPDLQAIVVSRHAASGHCTGEHNF